MKPYFPAVSVLAFLILVPLSYVSAECNSTLSEEQKIEALILAVEKLDGTFIRNGEEHSSGEAAAHLRLKVSNAKKSIFSFGKEWTAEEFIDKLATKSSLSGIAYEIKLKNGKRYLSADWLRIELKKMNHGCS
jgi:hypothetical protein